MRKGLLLDRDGVINREIGQHVASEDEFEFLPDIFVFLRKARDLGFIIAIVSNQSGIAKGLYDHRTLEHIHQSLLQRAEEEGVKIADIFYAPHHPSKGRSLFRKPEPLMLERAMAKHGMDPERTLYFGDKESDREAGERAGVRTILVEPNTSLLPYLDELKRFS